ncbi:mucin-15 [Osmerus eperlanus]|uniref:mucin-15 n=1 Tax=Osmerus eperlanus TaxID=29151 RepID=UPI002E1575AD
MWNKRTEMDQSLRITAGLLLLLQVFHVALLQDPTDSPGRIIDQSWLRQPIKSQLKNEDVESTNGQKNSILAGSLLISSGDVDDGDIQTLDGVTFVTMSPNVSSEEMEDPVSSANNVSINANQSTDATAEQIGYNNSTTTLPDTTTQPITMLLNMSTSNITDLIETTTALDFNVTKETTTETGTNGTTNSTEDNVKGDNDTVITTATSTPTTNEPEKKPSTAPPVTELTSGTTTLKKTTGSTTIMAPSTIDSFNSTTFYSASGSNSEKGFAADIKKNKKSEAWGAILGTAAAVAFVGLVVYVILKKRRQREFTHRKLVEEFPPDPVLRLDNSEPLDLKYDGSAYYNPGLQMDNIQMTNFPQGLRN